jgi:hypothetical protein
MDRPTRLTIPQNTQMVYEGSRSLVRRPMQVDQDSLDLEKVALESIEVSPRLEVLRGGAAVDSTMVSQIISE